MLPELPLCSQSDVAPDPSRDYATVVRAYHEAMEYAEGYRVEIVEGLICITPRDFPLHTLIVDEVRTSLEGRMPEGYGVFANTCCEEPVIDRYFPDLAVWPATLLCAGSGLALPGDRSLLAVEVTSGKVRHRDLAKAAGYARAEVPVFLLVDSEKRSSAVYSRPADGMYRHRRESPFGLPIDLPLDPPVTIDTSEF